jgi:hypothetical protein
MTVPFTQKIFGVTDGLTWEWAVIFGLSIVPVTVIEVIKLAKARITQTVD